MQNAKWQMAVLLLQRLLIVPLVAHCWSMRKEEGERASGGEGRPKEWFAACVFRLRANGRHLEEGAPTTACNDGGGDDDHRCSPFQSIPDRDSRRCKEREEGQKRLFKQQQQH